MDHFGKMVYFPPKMGHLSPMDCFGEMDHLSDIIHDITGTIGAWRFLQRK